MKPMPKNKADEKTYAGFEQGPIRPPSEAASLLLRVTRNCPWNRCTFCPVYKGEKFSLRPLPHILLDIDTVATQLERIEEYQQRYGPVTYRELGRLADDLDEATEMALYAAHNWLAGGKKSIFLQDANSLVAKPDEIVQILEHIRASFPWPKRITTYARAQTIDRIEAADLERFAAAGLNRIHIGLESGADEVLEMVQKGTTQAQHVRAGLKVKAAGMELSEYVMPGLGGRRLSREHALATAAAINQINPDYIRLRTLAIPNHTELYEAWQSGRFDKLTDLEVAEELLLFLRQLEGVTSFLRSDHILNLFQEIEGQLPQDQAAMAGVIENFLQLPAEERLRYQLGRRLGLLGRVNDLELPGRRERIDLASSQYGVTLDNLDEKLDELMKRFI